MVKNLTASAGDMGSIPGQGRSHVLRSNQALVPQLLRLCSEAQEPQLLSPSALEPELQTGEATTMRNPRTTTSKKPRQQQRPSTAKHK